MGDADRVVALFGHRLAGAEPTGVGRHAAELVRALTLCRHDGLRYRTTTLREPPPKWSPRGVEHMAVRGPRRPLALAWAFGGGPRLERLVPRVDLVHTLLTWLPVRTRRPTVATVHDLMFLHHPEWYPRRDRLSYRQAVRQVAAEAALVVTGSQFVAGEIVALLGIEPERVRVVHHGVPAAFAAPPPAEVVTDTCARWGVEPGRFLLAVGAVSHRKNLGIVARALSRLPATGGIELVLVGPAGAGSDQLRAKMERLGLGARVAILGFLADNDLVALMAAASSLVHPSRDEGFGYPPLEAMALGTPVLAAAAASLPEIVGDGGVLLDPDAPDAWAGAISRLRTDPEHRAHLAAAGRARAAEFTPEAEAEAIVKLHREVLGER